jgi:Tfp pilus assembly protein PilO
MTNLKQSGLLELQPRFIALMLGAIIALTSTAAYLYLFKHDLKELKEMRQLHSKSQRTVNRQEQALGNLEIETVRQEIADLKFKLYGKRARQHPGQMVSFIIGELDVVAAKNRVQLVSVKPGAPSQVLIFEEIPFDIEVRGRYFDLYQWLLDAEQQLRPMVVKKFHLIPPSQGDIIRMELRIVSYLPPDAI